VSRAGLPGALWQTTQILPRPQFPSIWDSWTQGFLLRRRTNPPRLSRSSCSLPYLTARSGQSVRLNPPRTFSWQLNSYALQSGKIGGAQSRFVGYKVRIRLAPRCDHKAIIGPYPGIDIREMELGKEWWKLSKYEYTLLIVLILGKRLEHTQVLLD
jgi:hypothetical protein